jgi:fatty-acyl-CoA synthase
VALWLGLSRVGVVTALLNTNLTGERLAHCVREASPRAWIVGPELIEETRSALAHLDAVPPLYSADLVGSGAESAAPPAASGRSAAAAAADPAAASIPSLDARLAAVSPGPIPRDRLEARRGSDLMFLIYTSGTTGLPKAARISHLKAVLTGMASLKSQALDVDDRTYCCLPSTTPRAA